MPKQITVTIDETGEATVDYQGYHGKACMKDNWLEKLLGTVKRRVFKKEYNEVEVITSRN
jgi:hypothetical protein